MTVADEILKPLIFDMSKAMNLVSSSPVEQQQQLQRHQHLYQQNQLHQQQKELHPQHTQKEQQQHPQPHQNKQQQHQDEQFIRINVSGMTYVTLRETLDDFPGTLHGNEEQR